MDADSVDAEKVARFSEENVFPRAHAVRRLLPKGLGGSSVQPQVVN